MNDNCPMLARLSAFVVWALVAGAAVFWGLRLFVSPTAAPASAVSVADGTALRGDLSRLFGAVEVAAAEAPPAESTRFKLLGVLAGQNAADVSSGVALISIDGKPPRPYRAGARVEDQLVLRSVSLRTAAFGPEQGPVAFTLEIPRMAEPATGTLNPVDPSQLTVAPPPRPVPPQPQQPAPSIAPAPMAAPPSVEGGANPGGASPSTSNRFRPRGGPGGPAEPAR